MQAEEKYDAWKGWWAWIYRSVWDIFFGMFLLNCANLIEYLTSYLFLLEEVRVHDSEVVCKDRVRMKAVKQHTTHQQTSTIQQ